MSKGREFEGHGNLWNGGDIPQCSQCGKDFDEARRGGHILYDAPVSDYQVCSRPECLISFCEGNFVEIEEK